jgi:hypothetical protein
MREDEPNSMATEPTENTEKTIIAGDGPHKGTGSWCGWCPSIKNYTHRKGAKAQRRKGCKVVVFLLRSFFASLRLKRLYGRILFKGRIVTRWIFLFQYCFRVFRGFRGHICHI